ncbi:MAG: hypothetical protein IJV61_06435 [Paludibacteraceae bacterium]|nr:hypothetical protein [Paludibacteraceae bacterium]
MKTLRYLLMVVAMVSVLSVSAKGTTQLPEAQMKSTSVMVGSGSSLPQAATTGAVLTGETPGTYSSVYHPGGPRRITINPGDEPGPDEGDNSEPWQDPIGDAVWPLALLACAYLMIRVYRRKRSV